MSLASRRAALLAAGLALLAAGSAQAAVLHVGPGHRYARPCRAIAAAHSGDTVAIDARGNGTYDGDVCAWSTDRLRIAGVHGRARIDAAGRLSEGKGIWVIGGADTLVDRVELSGATSPSDRNGAGIRQQGPGLTVRRSFLHDNDDGILVDADPRSDITIVATELARNGFGDGYSHNLYVGHVHRLTLRDSWSHDARVGHLVKSRADVNRILQNRLTEQHGTGSYELDLPDGGRAYVAGNVFQQGSRSENPALLSYGAESLANPRSRLSVVHNTFVDGLGRGAAIHVAPAAAARARIAGNLSTGSSALVDQPAARVVANCVPARPRFVAPARYDYRLRRRSPCVDAVRRPDRAPARQYAYDLRHERRRVVGRAPDAGAFEWRPRRR
ncbi:MAG TPA: hypothetical protein VFT50_13005 [Baekduia sp.]|nr:hypothetical protein [Baekduia sp.]